LNNTHIFGFWGGYPEDDPGKRWIPVEHVLSLRESPSRLPAKFADKLYKSGESGMGFVVFAVRFSDSSQKAFIAGDAVDFINYPAGKGANNVVNVVPHAGRDAKPVQSPEHFWCLFSDESTKRAYRMGLTKPLKVEKGTLWHRLKSARTPR
jgi:hypothetical protein